MRVTTLGLVVVSLGCISEMRLAARDRFSTQYRCPVERVRQEELGAGAFRVGGCGHEAVYVCQSADGLAALGDPATCRQEQAVR